jgi:hypothetical protein
MADTYIDPIALMLFGSAIASLAVLVWLAIQGTRTALWATLVMSLLTLAVWAWAGWQLVDAASSSVTSLSADLGKIVDALGTALLMGLLFAVLLPVWGIFVAVALGVFWFKRRRGRDQTIRVESV